MSDWYHINRHDVELKGGRTLFAEYSSLGEALSAIFPEYPWDTSKFKIRSPAGFWKDRQNLLQALDNVESRLGVRKGIISIFSLYILILYFYLYIA